MDKEKLLKKYAKYYKYITKLNEYPLDETPSLSELGINQSIKQSCWKDIKELKNNGEFKGTIVDYLCYLATEFFLTEQVYPKQYLEIDLYHDIKSSENKNNIRRLFGKNSKYLLGFIEDKLPHLNEEGLINQQFIQSSIIQLHSLETINESTEINLKQITEVSQALKKQANDLIETLKGNK